MAIFSRNRNSISLKTLAVLSINLIMSLVVQPVQGSISPSIMFGKICFPAITAIPCIRLYYKGTKILTEQGSSKTTTFSIPVERGLRQFYLLITENAPTMVRHGKTNTIQYWSISREQPYLFYRLRYIDDGKTSGWEITKETLPNNIIPDDTIIMMYAPSYIQTLKGGSANEFPSIIIKDNVVQLAGSEQKLMDHASQLMLTSCLNLDSCHRSPQYLTKLASDNKKVIILAS